MTKVSIIGSGFSGLAAAAMLGKAGKEVHVFEKNKTIGGRARQFEAEGFKFDMGPSWYWMPEVFEHFYNQFGYQTSDFYKLERLNPSYEVIFKDSRLKLPASLDELYEMFEDIETGSGPKLKKFLEEAKYKYEAGMGTYVWKPGKSLLEYADTEVLKSMFKLQMLSSVSSQVRKLFKDTRLVQILEFPVLFLGAKPSSTPALYTLMNHADMALGTWYPMGGMNQIVKAFEKICREQGVCFHTANPIASFNYKNDKIVSLNHEDSTITDTDYVIGACDYHHLDQYILDSEYANYNSKYWDSRKMAPSSLLFYVGLKKKIPNIKHHTLFFDADFDNHAHEIYESHKWPTDPLFYICSPSVTDDSVAPKGCENIFILMPISTKLDDQDEIHEKYFDLISKRIQQTFDYTIGENILYKRAFSIQDFKTEYNSFDGNAYGLANTLDQTGPLKPKLLSKKLSNLVYAGQLTVPGPGVPPSIISGQLAANQILYLI